MAVVAGFRRQDDAQWHDLKELVTESTNRLVVKLTALAVSFDVGKFSLF